MVAPGRVRRYDGAGRSRSPDGRDRGHRRSWKVDGVVAGEGVVVGGADGDGDRGGGCVTNRVAVVGDDDVVAQEGCAGDGDDADADAEEPGGDGEPRR